MKKFFSELLKKRVFKVFVLLLSVTLVLVLSRPFSSVSLWDDIKVVGFDIVWAFLSYIMYAMTFIALDIFNNALSIGDLKKKLPKGAIIHKKGNGVVLAYWVESIGNNRYKAVNCQFDLEGDKALITTSLTEAPKKFSGTLEGALKTINNKTLVV